MTLYNGNRTAEKEYIKDTVNLNNFGVLLHDTKTIEEFQKRSGMEGAYSTEYQHHYINAVGRVEADGQILDVAIPLVLYNYHQEVAGASVEFNLKEVGEANNDAMKLAIEKFKELEETEMFAALVENMGVTQWVLEGMNSIHAHPSGVNRFSGTDLRADIHHPGVNFPLNTGTNVANFASIIQHKNDFAEIIHTEYRIFNGEADGVRHYEKGRCMTIIRGYANEPVEEWKPVGPGPIDAIFGTTRPQPPKPAPEKDRKNYTLRDGFMPLEGKEIEKELFDLWNICSFMPDISMILKTNVLKGRGRLQNSGKYKAPNARNDIRNGIEYEDDSLFPYWQSGNRKGPVVDNYKIWASSVIEKANDLELLGYTKTELMTWDAIEVVQTWKSEELDIADAKAEEAALEDQEIDEMINMLVADNIMGETKLRAFAPKRIKEVFFESYGIDFTEGV